MSFSTDHPSVENYKTSGFGCHMGWGARPALLIIDVCTAYWADGSPLDIRSNPAAAASPDSMRRLLAAGLPSSPSQSSIDNIERDDSDRDVVIQQEMAIVPYSIPQSNTHHPHFWMRDSSISNLELSKSGKKGTLAVTGTGCRASFPIRRKATA